METVKRTLKDGTTSLCFKATDAEIRTLMADDTGLCLACGAERDCCEPDARRYPCEACGERRVYGTQELVIMGRFLEEGE